MVTTLLEVHAFLLGESALEGVWFGDRHPTRRGAFWWRSVLREAIAQEQPKLKHKMPARGCYTCKHEDERIGVPPCLTCSGKNWEPKP